MSKTEFVVTMIVVLTFTYLLSLHDKPLHNKQPDNTYLLCSTPGGGCEVTVKPLPIIKE